MKEEEEMIEIEETEIEIGIEIEIETVQRKISALTVEKLVIGNFILILLMFYFLIFCSS